MKCIFCDPGRPIVAENDHACAIRDAFPVSTGHTLVIPREHVSDILRLSPQSYAACFELVRSVAAELEATLGPDGFNIGVNCGEAAGQTVMHAHIHVIPRFTGDTANPRGGVRGVIAGKGDYS